MRTIHIDELGSELSAHLHSVKDGEEILVRDNDGPVARILPYSLGTWTGQEMQMVARGQLKMPQEPMDLEAFFRMPAANVSQADAVSAAVEGRGDR